MKSVGFNLGILAVALLSAACAADEGAISTRGAGKGEPGVKTSVSATDPEPESASSSKKSKSKSAAPSETDPVVDPETESGTDTGSETGTATGTGTGTGTGSQALPTVTWATVYSNYFAKTSVGACAAAGCHATSKGRFKCGTTADDCYAGLVASKLIDTANPSASKLVDVDLSPLVWFGGSMPPKGKASQTAIDEITAWVAAGAKNN